MRKTFFIVITALLVYGCQTGSKTGPAIVKLTLENSELETASLTIIKNHITYEREKIESQLNEEGTFVFEVDVEHPQLVYLSMGDSRSMAYVSSGGTIELTGDLQDWQSTLEFSGSLASANEILRAKTQEVDPAYSQRQIVGKIQESTAEEYAKFNNEFLVSSLALLENYNGDNAPGKEFENWYTSDATYQKYMNMFYYPMYYSYFNGTEPDLPEDYFSFLDEAMEYDASHFSISSFQEFLKQHLQYTISENQESVPADLEDVQQTLWVIENYYEGEAQDLLKASTINESINWGDFAIAEKVFFEFKESDAKQNYIDILQKSYDAALRVSPGKQAPQFELTNIDGQTVSLDDFRGKVVYLDFWASWCGPCMREVPHAKELKKRFQTEEDLVFLYISVDEDKDAWKRTVDEREIKGVHLNIDGMDSEVANLYNVKGVPTFFIIDRDGKIHDNRPGRPSSGEEVIDQQLRAALEGTSV